MIYTPGQKIFKLYKVVAVIGYGKDWAAYYVDADYSDEYAAAHGEKLSAEVARMMFPDIPGYYRS